MSVRQLSIAFDPHTKALLRRMARERGVSVALVVREIVALHLAPSAPPAATGASRG